MRKLILLSAIILLSNSCVTTPATIPVKLNCPPTLILPVMNEIQASEMFLLSTETYNILAHRELLLKERNTTLCTIIESTHQ